MAMRFEHEFTVPVPVERAWSALLDVERVAPCLPGAALEKVEDDHMTGRMKVKVGPITLVYRGKATFEDVDAEARTLTIRASGKESRGPGTASAAVVARLRPEGPGDSGTRVTVETAFTVTGRPAQFGRGVMAEVGAKLIDRFAANLSALLEGRREQAGSTAAGASGTGETEGAAPSPVPQQAAAEGAAARETRAPEPSGGRERPADLEEPAETGGPAGVRGPADANGPTGTGGPAGTEELTGAGGLAGSEGVAASEVRGRPAGVTLDGGDRLSEQEASRRHLTAVPSTRETATAEESLGRDTHPAGTARTSLTPDEEALDLLEIAGIPLLKRAAPLAAALAGVVLAGWLVRRALRRRRGVSARRRTGTSSRR
ncbi:SRPBCC family protein [Streptosporangium carneum]|uniref:Carbon monoxide dehydrogenase subunit G n=1 Tax=Streptosporangium carneum TaxID=47481 RepID=A0A9W6MET5_9ACTN|nr:SRPBCC family protein [Streptosporangium carneum]GLK11934.1 carbon monoxide dehydrogenase subunit G [Streptosporangium carneum]